MSERTIVGHYSARTLSELQASPGKVVFPISVATDLLIEELRKRLPKLTDEQRMFVFHQIEDGYCMFCGANRDGRCHCTNDE